MNKEIIVLVVLLASLIHGPLHAQTKRIAVAYSAISATQSGFYLAKDAKVFDKHGLFVDPVYVAGGSEYLKRLSPENSLWPWRVAISSLLISPAAIL